MAVQVNQQQKSDDTAKMIEGAKMAYEIYGGLKGGSKKASAPSGSNPRDRYIYTMANNDSGVLT